MSINVTYEGRSVPVEDGETILEALERSGISAPSSCRSGVCQFCMVRAVDGPVPPRSQDGLKPSLKETGHFLACVARPQQSLTCVPAHVAAFRGPVKILEIRSLAADIALVRLERPSTLDFSAGQFMTLRRDDGLTRSYSIASSADEKDYFDIHVRRVPRGRMSGWLHEVARPGDELWAEGPKGDCMYISGAPDEPLSLAGTGTGMAPLFAIAQDAVRKGHRGPIHIYHGAPSASRLYLVDEFRSLAEQSPNIRYVRCLLQGEPETDVVIGSLRDAVVANASPKQRAYLCGEPTLVRDMKKQLFLRGVSYKRIYADPFIGTAD